MAPSADVLTDHDIIHALADDLPVGLWVARAPNGEFVYANRMFAEIMGQGGRDDAAAGSYSAPYGICTRDGQPYPEHRMPFVRALQEGRVVVVDDITIHRPDRTYVHVRAFARPVGDPVTHVVIAFFDITREVEAEAARAETEQRLHHAQRLQAVGTLAGGIAHDFNNLIFGIKLIAAELAAGETDPNKRTALGVIDDITERSAMLTRSLLGFARRGKHRVAPVAIDQVLEAMREILVRTLTGISIAFELDAGDVTVIGDQSQLEQVVMNLIVNARDALGEAGGGRVVVRTWRADTEVVLEVSDDGPGIPPELRERVFEPYFSTKTQGAERGTGLGLATVFGIVDAHGGSIAIEPGLDGRGTTMRVTLPLAARAEAIARRQARQAATIAAGTGTILVVDDDPIVLRAVANALELLGYTALSATDGETAIAMLRERHAEIRAVVLDMVMPTMSGRQAYAAMREVDPEVAVLAMSGHAMTDEIDALLALGVRGFLPKPYSLDVLASSLADVLTPVP